MCPDLVQRRGRQDLLCFEVGSHILDLHIGKPHRSLLPNHFGALLQANFKPGRAWAVDQLFFYCHFAFENIRSALLKSHGENFPVLFPACQLRRGSDTPVLDGCRSAQRLRNQPGRSVQPAEAPIELRLEGHRCHHCPGAKKPIMSHMGISHNGGMLKEF